MKISFFILFITLAKYAVAAAPNKVCIAKIEISNAIKKLNIPDCGLAKGLAQNSDVQDYHRNKIYEMLSDKLALQMEQNLEETSLFAQYYLSNNMELLPNGDSKLKTSCRLDKIEKIERCETKNYSGKVNLNDPSYQFRLALLKSKIKKNLPKSCTDQNLSLQNLLINKATLNLGVRSKSCPQESIKGSSCPIEGAAGAFKLSAQLDNESSARFIALLQNPKANPIEVESFFSIYPQFKLIKNTSADFKTSFINYIKSYKKDKGSAKDFINQFFFTDPHNQKTLSNTLADQCQELNNNIETFLCSKDLEGSQLASLSSDVSINLFGLNPSLKDSEIFDDLLGDGENFYTAYGFQCLAKSQIEKGKALDRKDSVDTWFKKFTENTRPNDVSDKDVKTSNDKFCSMYNCEEQTIANSGLCKKPGPITSKNLNEIFSCSTSTTIANKRAVCSNDIRKYISYIETLENIKKIQENAASPALGLSRSNTTAGSEPKAHYSAFLENYLGVNGTLMAEGKTITPAAIAEKTLEFKERNLNPIPPIHETIVKVKPMALASLNTNESSAPLNERPLTSGNQPLINHFETTSSQSEDQNLGTAKKSPRLAYGSKNSNNFNSPEDERENEVKKIRDELEQLTKSLKGTESEKLAAIADNNARFTPSSLNGGLKQDPYAGLNGAEKERMEQYQRNLTAWESRLRNWQSELSDRELRTPSSSSETSGAKRIEGTEGLAKIARNEGAIQLTASDKEKGKSGKVTNSMGTSGSADAPEASVSSDELAKLEIDSLKKLGINSKSAFVIRVLYQKKYYNIPVKTFFYKGKDIFVPLLNESNSVLSKIVLESPLFNDYKIFQAERQKERKAFAQLTL